MKRERARAKNIKLPVASTVRWVAAKQCATREYPRNRNALLRNFSATSLCLTFPSPGCLCCGKMCICARAMRRQVTSEFGCLTLVCTSTGEHWKRKNCCVFFRFLWLHFLFYFFVCLLLKIWKVENKPWKIKYSVCIAVSRIKIKERKEIQYLHSEIKPKKTCENSMWYDFHELVK